MKQFDCAMRCLFVEIMLFCLSIACIFEDSGGNSASEMHEWGGSTNFRQHDIDFVGISDKRRHFENNFFGGKLIIDIYVIDIYNQSFVVKHLWHLNYAFSAFIRNLVNSQKIM
jgi:hypothetical protein